MSPRIYGPGPGEPALLRALPDLKGIPVDDVTGRPTGELCGVLVEAGSGLVRYLDLGLNGAARHVLVPVGHVRFEDHADGLRVRLRAAGREDLYEVPPFRAESALDAKYESELMIAFSRLFYGEHYYAHPAYDHTRMFAGAHPVVGEAPLEEPVGLYPLSRLRRWRVAKGEPDVRGWLIRGADGVEAGTVTDLIVEPAAQQVRYLLVQRSGDGATTVLPIGYAELDRAAQEVRSGPLRADDIAALAAVDGRAETLDRETERILLEQVEARLSGDRRYQRPDFLAPPIH
ncbi:MAG: PRC-barrel domain-containing protein [Longimicrobiales bacterium]